MDDDLSIRKLLRAALEKNGYNAILCVSGEEALASLDKYHIDAVILDIVLPNMDGLEVLKEIRSSSRRPLPVIMLTCKNSEIETVVGLEMGADDYLIKPVRYHELVARLKTLFRRTATTSQTEHQTLTVHGMEIKLGNRAIHINNESVLLTHMEFELLTLLAKNLGRVFSRENLLDILWHEEQYVETRTVDVHITRLRKKWKSTA